jgi:hypothetical protein
VTNLKIRLSGEAEQQGRRKGRYGDELLRTITSFGGGYSHTNLKLFQQFYQMYPRLLEGPIGHTLRE